MPHIRREIWFLTAIKIIIFQPHTSLAGWEPSNVPALWQVQ
ncbi:carbohydrate-binding protein [Anaerocolumna aminovalerica]